MPNPPVRPRARYYLAGFLVFTAAVLAIGTRSYFSQREIADASWRGQLDQMASAKVSRVAAWRAERLGDGAVAVADTPLMPVVRHVLDGDERTDDHQRVLGWMDAMRANYQYSNIVLLDSSGHVRLSSGTLFGTPDQYAAMARNTPPAGTVELRDVPGPPAFAQPHFVLLVALGEPKKPATGTVLLGIDPATTLYPSALVWPESRTGHISLIRREGDAIRYLSPRGRDAGDPQVRSRELPIPDSSWSILVTIDRAEADAPLGATVARLLEIGSALVVLCAFGAFLAWREQKSTFEQSELERRALVGHYEFLTRFGNDAITLIDGDGMIVEVNDRAIEWFGYSREEFLTMHVSRLRGPDAAAEFGRTWDALREQRSLVFETIDRRKDGSVFPVEVSVRLIEIDGHPFAQSILRDITERRRAEAQITHLNRLNAVLSGCSRAIVESRTESELFDRVCAIAASQGGFRVASISLVDPATRAIVPVARAGEGGGFLDRIALSSDEGQYGQGGAGRCIRERRPIVCNDIPNEPSMAPWRDDAMHYGLFSSIALPLRRFGREVGVLGLHSAEAGFFNDAEAKLAEEVADSISFALDSLEQELRRQRADAELRASRERLERVLDAIDEGYWDWHPSTGDVHLSARYHTMLGYVPGELSIGWDAWQEMTHPEDAPVVDAAFKKFLDSRQDAFSVEYRMRCKSGDYIWVLSRGKVADRDTAGMPTRLVGTHTDITERRKLEDQFLQAQKLESVGRLAGGIAHDFNNLLTVVNGYSEMVIRTLGAGDPNWQHLDAIRMAGQRAAALTQQLLAFSRKQTTQPRALRLNAAVTEFQPLLRRLVGEHIELVVRLDAPADQVLADPSQLNQVILNLVVNARDAMESGGRLFIHTANKELVGDEAPDIIPGTYVVLSVTDTGTGMDEETCAQIFEPFFTTKDRGKGTGLGLSTVYGVVRQSGGFVRVDSKLGEGATFAVHLPRTAIEIQPVETVVRSTRVSGSETILVVEDQAAVRMLAVEALRALGYAVLSAGDGLEALHVAERHDGVIHLLLTDVVMPGLDGKSLADRLTVLRPDTKVIFTSGYTDDVIGLSGVLDTGVAFLPKPYTADTLGAKVREALGVVVKVSVPLLAKRRTVLVVDDDANVRSLFVECLDANYRVLQAADGIEAMEVVRRETDIELLITDLFMPKQEGRETIQAIREIRPDMRIIAISGAFGGQFLHTTERLGVDATLLKPIRLDVLLSTVDQVLNRAIPAS